jgi:hypothetical protein
VCGCLYVNDGWLVDGIVAYLFINLIIYYFFRVWALRDVMCWEFVRGYSNPTSSTFTSYPNLPTTHILNDNEWDDVIEVIQQALLLSDSRHA